MELIYRHGQIDKVFMEQDKPRAIGTLNDIESLAQALGISVEDIGVGKNTVYPEIISTGST